MKVTPEEFDEQLTRVVRPLVRALEMMGGSADATQLALYLQIGGPAIKQRVEQAIQLGLVKVEGNQVIAEGPKKSTKRSIAPLRSERSSSVAQGRLVRVPTSPKVLRQLQYDPRPPVSSTTPVIVPPPKLPVSTIQPEPPQPTTIVEEEEAEMPTVTKPAPGTLRHKILEALMEGSVERTVKDEIARRARVPNDPTLATTLGLLEKEDLIARQRDGRYIVGAEITDFGRALMADEVVPDATPAGDHQDNVKPAGNTSVLVEQITTPLDVVLERMMPMLSEAVGGALADFVAERDALAACVTELTSECAALTARAEEAEQRLSERDEQVAAFTTELDRLNQQLAGIIALAQGITKES